MTTFDTSSTSSYYFYLPTIREVGVCLPLSPFMEEVLTVLNVAYSKITPNDWSLIRPFEIVC